MRFNIIKYPIILLALILLQKSFISVIALSKLNITPDIVLIAVIYIGIKEGKIGGSVYGFFAGLLLDILSGSFVGLLALAYTVSGFVAGFFKTEGDRFLSKYNFLLVTFICSLISCFLYYGLYSQGTSTGFADVMLLYVFTSATYTTLISMVILVIPKRKTLERGFTD
ncbi:MAG: rod shape-determining protein MreD [Ignavibacteriae bacterium]|jgi:rod shape-determining protein MreD|nr:rod shape-determining protein MreD [Ignavibacteriota bacterium]